MDLLEALHWRYATKKYSNKKVSDEVLERIVAAINLSASSRGIQPYRLFVIENLTLRKKLGVAAPFNPQVTEASHLLVFAAFDSVDEKSIDSYIELIAKEREISLESLKKYKHKGLMGLLNMVDGEFLNWAKNQAFIALGTGLITAAAEKVDATPMEGFDSNRFDEILGLKEKGLKSVVLLSLGYRDEENDSFANLKKVRWPKNEFVTFIK